MAGLAKWLVSRYDLVTRRLDKTIPIMWTLRAQRKRLASLGGCSTILLSGRHIPSGMIR